MSELIKREDAIKITWIEPQYYDPLNVLTEARERLKALPTVDAVPVVRCKDCRYGKEACGNIECTVDIGSTWAEYHGYEWFCPLGERR